SNLFSSNTPMPDSAVASTANLANNTSPLSNATASSSTIIPGRGAAEAFAPSAPVPATNIPTQTASANATPAPPASIISLPQPSPITSASAPSATVPSVTTPAVTTPSAT